MTDQTYTPMTGKTVIITGAARGLGREYALQLGRRGASVVLADLNDCAESEALLTAEGIACMSVKVDVADENSTKAMAAAAVERFGRIDVLVNNAALWADLKNTPFTDIDPGLWDRCMAVNVKGVWNCSKAVFAAMREAGGGSIINIASLAATYGMPYALHYTASKAAVIGITRGLAREVGRHWIRVNSVAPSLVLTEATSQFFDDKLDKATDAIKAGQSLKGNLTPQDVVGAVLFLAGEDSRFVTGQTLMVDGGTTLL
ncbi:SDR family NAD(P)-dependent oxidoreductase [Cupriavidus consociatus]|uniref:SDR family NAD(P)-dependent oxidoreductase n=1 Tax=Cupriavidus consociatus TaxID=2821357 RepID=UPI001FD72DEC|nr:MULTISPECIES: glucose 1-dehydrogenase [unclassified Cupriavidus]MDK2657838.1 glucose 1-dehydrogenase [Cupriavidus sp. LEh21]